MPEWLRATRPLLRPGTEVREGKGPPIPTLKSWQIFFKNSLHFWTNLIFFYHKWKMRPPREWKYFPFLTFSTLMASLREPILPASA